MGDVHRAKTVVQARDIHGGVHTHYHPVPRSHPVPRTLRPAIHYFTDREDLLSELTDAWRRARESGVPLVVMISGPEGIGKTELATKWSWQIAGEVPGPHLHAEMKDGGLVSAKEACGGFLRAMGVPPAELPQNLGEMTAMFRTLTSEAPALVLLDDVTLASQVRAVVPNSAGSVVVVTTREPLDHVPWAESFEVEPLGHAASVLLIERLAGTGDGAETIASLCRGQPLPLAAAARQMKLRRSHLVDEITAEGSAGDEDAAMVVFGIAYRGLGAEAARLFRCLGALVGRRFSADLAAAAAGLDDVAAPLAELVDAGLVDEVGDTFRLHALALRYAREQASQDEHEAALRRVVDWYRRMAVAADFAVMPQRWWLGPEYENYRGQRPPIERAAAWQWLEDQRASMLAVVGAAAERGWYDQALQLVEAQWSLCFKGKYHDHWLAVFELGRDAALRLGDLKFEGRMRCQLGFGYMELNRLDDAATEFAEASRAERQVGHVRGLATAVESLGLLELRRSGAEDLPVLTARGEFAARALELLTANLTLNLQMSEENDDDRAVALAWRHRGRALSASGNHEDAIRHLTRARELIEAIPDPYNEGRALTDLGQAYLRAGRAAEAGPVLREAIDVLGTDENRVERAVVFETLSAAAAREGDHEAAASWLEQALEVLGGRPAAKAEKLRERLAALTGSA